MSLNVIYVIQFCKTMRKTLQNKLMKFVNDIKEKLLIHFYHQIID